MKPSFDTWIIVNAIKAPILGTDYDAWGIYLGVKMGQSKNPYTLGNISLLFAVADSRKLVEYNLTTDQRSEISRIYTERKDLSEEEILHVQQNWNELVKAASNKREKRHILTENIVAASDNIGALNKLIKYNTKEGTIKNGILLHRDFGTEGEDRKALIPISNAAPTIRKLSMDEIFSDHQLKVKFKRIAANTIQLFIGKKGSYDIHTDHTLRSLIMKREGQGEDEMADFVQNANDMTAPLHMDKLERFLERLDHFGLHYQSEAKELEDWELENEEDWQKKSKKNEGSFRYELGRPYGQGSNPISSLVNYEEPSPSHPFGVVEYSRLLSDTEKYNFTLIPIFNHVEEPYHAWKAFIKNTPLKTEFSEILEQVKNSRFHQAILTLGYFITNNPHEDGNAEFVFGKYTEEDLGRAAYEDHFGFITPIDELIEQLTIELEAA